MRLSVVVIAAATSLAAGAALAKLPAPTQSRGKTVAAAR
jgi:hypothetical protein